MLTKRSKFDIEDLEEIPGVAERLEEAKEIRKKYNKNIYSVIKSEVKSQSEMNKKKVYFLADIEDKEREGNWVR